MTLGKFSLLLLVSNIISILLIALTAYMIYDDKPYWGWVLFAAIICAYGPKTRKDKSE